jgi:hypothetical protein
MGRLKIQEMHVTLVYFMTIFQVGKKKTSSINHKLNKRKRKMKRNDMKKEKI